MKQIIQTIEIYNQNAYGKSELPPVSQNTHSFVLDMEKYGMTENIIVRMETMDNTWCFSESSQYQISKEKESYFQKKIFQGDMFTLKTKEGTPFILRIGYAEIGMEVFDKYLLDKQHVVSIGYAASNTMILPQNSLISRIHLELKYEDKEWLLQDRSTNGTYINQKKAHSRQVLKFGDQIHVFGYTFVFLKDILAVPTKQITFQETGIFRQADRETVKWISNIPVYGAAIIDNKEHFHRPPRNIANYETDPFVIEGPPALREIPQRSLFMTIGPSLTMMIPMLLSFAVIGSNLLMGAGMFIGSAVIGAFWAYMNLQEQKQRGIKEEQLRLTKYKEYLQKKEEGLQKQYQYNSREMCKMYPSVKELLDRKEINSILWSRNEKQEDFLFIRLGKGDKKSLASIEIPQERFQLLDDSLLHEPARLKNTYGMMHNIPLGIDLQQKKMLGIIGGTGKSNAYRILRNIIAQIALNNCYTDVKLVLLADKNVYEDRQLIDSAKWLPHFWDDNQTVRYMADNQETISEIVYDALLPELRNRKEGIESSGRQDGYLPWFVILVLHPEMLDHSPLRNFIYDNSNKISVSTILCVERYEQLPNMCENIVQNDADFQGMYSVRDAQKDKEKIVYDMVSCKEIHMLSHRLAPIRVASQEEESSIPEKVTFLEMYQVHTVNELGVKDRWKQNRSYETMRVPVGKKSGGTLCYLDIHEKAHGPHGLVAGTTGSGKSEALQSYILSLAVNFSPEDVNFFLIDFKGGGMASLFDNDFRQLPHLVGQISNLSGNQTHRAMVSIVSENTRRQRMFTENGVNNISEYTKLYKNNEVKIPLPHLFIIIDEFAELKREQPDFMAELISVAAIGRSLGVHLILATQKPSGTVDDKIWSNTRFRICLRVQEPQDSNDMLHRAEAAYIKNTGRAFFQVGTDEIFEQFQSAWSGALVKNSEQHDTGDIARTYMLTGKTTVTGNHQRLKNRAEKKRKWIKTILQIWNQVLEQTECSVKRYLVNEEARNRVNARLFRTLKEREINIPENPFHIARFLDFAALYEEIGIDDRENLDEAAQKLIAGAEQTGRKLPEAKGKTELDAVVEYLQETAVNQNLMPKTRLWLPELRNRILLAELTESCHISAAMKAWELALDDRWTLDAVIGMYDDPQHQYQGNLSVDFANQGHYLVCGSAGSGKSTLLQTMLFSIVTKYPPERVNVYVIDYSSGMLEGFRDMPHCGGIMGEQDQEEIGKFFFLIGRILAERKRLLKGGSYSNYVRTHQEKLPAILVMIDQYPAFSERTGQIYDNQILTLAKEGGNNGIFFVLSSNTIGSGGVPAKLADCIQGRISLQMNDKFQYSDVLQVNRIDIQPEEGVKGRGLVSVHGDVMEFQSALAIDAPDDYRRSEAIEKLCQQMKKQYTGTSARKVPVIPETPVYSEFMQNNEVKKALAKPGLLPLGYDKHSASVWSLDMRNFFCFIISGKNRTGKRNMMQMVMSVAREKKGQVYVLSSGGILQKKAEETGCHYLPLNGDITGFCRELMDILTIRNKKKHELEVAGYSDQEIYNEMSREQSIFILIEDMAGFVEQLYHPQNGDQSIRSFFETFFNKGWLHQIFIFGGINQDNNSRVMGRPVFDYFVRDKTGIHFGGNANAQQLFDFDYLSFKEQNKPEKPGVGLLSAGNGLLHGKVVVPLAGR